MNQQIDHKQEIGLLRIFADAGAGDEKSTMSRTRKPRIVLFSPSLTTAVSGYSTHVNMLLSSSLADEFELLHFRTGSNEWNESKLRKIWRLAVSPFALAAYLLWRRPRIVHINTSMNGKAYWRDLSLLAVARLFRRKIVYQVHGGALPQNFFPRSRILTGLLRRVLLTPEAVAVLSQEELAAYRAFDGRIKVHLTPNAISADVLEIPRSVNLDAPLRLVFVGRLVASKGLFELVEALRLLKERGHQFTLQIAGRGPDEDALNKAVQDAGIEDRVRFLGAVFGTAKRQLWLNSDILVYPTWQEGLPYALLEAMAAGCVPVTCPVAAIPDVMQDGVHGLFIPLRNPEQLAKAVARLDLHRDDMARMAAAGRARVREQYTTGRLAEDFRRLYSSL